MPRTEYTVRRPGATRPYFQTDSANVAEALSRIGMVVTAETRAAPDPFAE